ncbi:NAD(P)-dependent oxidoreductase [Siccirubricoccus phaeus]|uniref:NAD(P)-dependent oxidoreductase n=1 Tax=Siccirubricoccus phaeus TaxID=2595053 RepID=UPI0011F1822E|nr:NAD(P)-dependent oxidoreductase [Siccirubricoccus phaeus]
MPKPPILLAMPLPADLVARLVGRYEVLGPLERVVPEAVPPEAAGARALVTLGGFATDAALLAALPRLELVCCYGTGIEGVDRDAVAARGIRVTHGRDTNATAVAEFAMGLVLATARAILAGDRLVRSGGWTSLRIDRMPLVPGLEGKRLGVYGLGAIGERVARRAAGFEMAIGYHGRAPHPGVDYAYFPTLLGLAEWADVLVVATRASPETRGSVNRQVLEALGREGVLVNVARGVIVDEPALCQALEEGVIAGAGLDVYAEEPHVPERLRALPNVVLTPHMAALSYAAQAAQQATLEESLDCFFAGRPLRWEIP